MKISVDNRIYSKETLLRTAFSFSDKVYLHLEQSDNSWIVSWENKHGNDISPENFENELIQQQLRMELTEKTAEVRKILLARALASTIIEDKMQKNEATVEMNENEESILKGWFEEHENEI